LTTTLSRLFTQIIIIIIHEYYYGGAVALLLLDQRHVSQAKEQMSWFAKQRSVLCVGRFLQRTTVTARRSELE